MDHDFWIGDFKQKSISRSLSKSTWLASLQAVHRWAWQKWDLVRAEWPLDDPAAEQEPGAEIVQSLQPIIRAMGEKKKY